MSELDVVARPLATQRGVVFLTGAGLSVASGLAPYRKSKDAVWSRFITEWGTIERFKESPAAWWQEFWIKAHGDLGKTEVHPNPGHTGITDLVATRTAAALKTLVVTQNIDGLHRQAGVPEEQLVEIHGRYDRFVCSDAACEGYTRATTSVDLSGLADARVPLCPRCQAPLRPLVLLFDETYDSHPAYQMRKARAALNDADVLVCVGTSFSVGITDYALRAAVYGNAIIVNINIEPLQDERTRIINIVGPSEEILPDLAARVRELAAT